jgi:chaperonin cofactor prefoldin
MIPPSNKRQFQTDSVTIPKAEYEDLTTKVEILTKENKQLTTRCEALASALTDAQRTIERFQNKK